MNIVAPIDCYTGYGITSYNILKNVYQVDNSTAIFPIGGVKAEPSWDQELLKAVVSNRKKFDHNKPCLKIWHANDMFMRTAGRSKYAALTFFEIDKISDAERLNYQLLDTIILPSQWAKGVLENNGITTEIKVCPMGVDTSLFDANKDFSGKDKEKYIFINIGKWEIRKGHDVLLNIFNKAFTKEDNVELWMLNYNAFLKPADQQNWIDQYLGSPLGDKVKLYPRLPSQQQVANLIGMSDCGFFPARAEGWNNEAIEVMAMNKPLIITNYSAHTEFCNKDNSYLVDITETEPAQDGIWFHGEGNWAKIGKDQEEQAINHLRYVYRNNIRTNPNGLQTAQNLSWQKVANNIHNIVYG